MQHKTILEQYAKYAITDGGDMPMDEWLSAGKVDWKLLPPADLSKNNFWIEIENRWPGEWNRFRSWIDDYKKKVNWNLLFNSQSDYQDKEGKNAPAPKYHDLPAAMQLGIFIQYCLEEDHRYEFIEGLPSTMAEMIIEMREWFGEEENWGQQDKNNYNSNDAYDFSTQ